MKKKQIFAVAAAVTMSLALVGCTLSTPFQIMDGDGMVHEDPTATQTPDPVKPGNGEDEGGNTNNPVITEPEKTVDNDAIIDSFINGETKAKFDHVIADEDTYYSLDEMITARGEELLNWFAYDEEHTVSYTVTVNYAYIDCGNDGERDLGINIDYIVDPGYEDAYDQYIYDDFILMVIDGELKCITMTESYYRSYGEINEYGYVSEGGSGGANLHVFTGRFVNSKGEIVYDYNCEYYMGYAQPTIHAYCVPEDIRDEAPEEIFDYESSTFFNTSVYNFNESPDYPTDLNWVDGKYDAESQAKYDKYEKEYDEWLSKNIFVFEDENGDAPEIPADLKKFIDDNNITYYTPKEFNELLSKHQAEIGLTDTVKGGDYPEWILLYDQTGAFTEEIEKQYIGEYVDDLNDPNLQIAKGEDGKFIVQIGIYRLCFMDDGVGEFQDDKMVFTISDENGNPMEGYLIVTEDGEATVTFTKSEWDYIEDGATYYYTKSSDTPNIFVYEFDFDN